MHHFIIFITVNFFILFCILFTVYPVPKFLIIILYCMEISDEEETVRNSLDENRLKVKVEK